MLSEQYLKKEMSSYTQKTKVNFKKKIIQYIFIFYNDYRSI